MAKAARNAAAIVVVAALLGAAPLASAADRRTSAVSPAGTSLQHLRWDSPVVGAAIRDAVEGSSTFREMVAAINASDSYVVISAGRCGHGVRACFVSVRRAGSNRYMFVHIDPAKRDCELMASIGHELRHTLEVIAEPSVRSDAEKFFFYERVAIHLDSGERETLAARDAGNAVRSEINQFNRQLHAK